MFSLLAVVMYIVRSKKATSTIQKLQKNIYANLSFQEVIIWLEIENAALGILTFIVTAKLLRLIRFNQHVCRVFKNTEDVCATVVFIYRCYVDLLYCLSAFRGFDLRDGFEALLFDTQSYVFSTRTDSGARESETHQ